MALKYFGTDGIRGHANKWPVTPDVMMRLGMATARLLIEEASPARRRVLILIGKDTRRSGYMLQFALSAGFVAAGADVLSVGPTPTPAIAMLTRSMRADLGVMITASHNPHHDNGVKLFGADGYKPGDAFIAKIEARMDADLSEQGASAENIGQVEVRDGAIDRYVEAVKRTLPTDIALGGLKIVIDCANGAAYRAGPVALWELGAELIVHGNKPDGRNINHDCGSMHPQRLAGLVVDSKADLGVALDGDGDRVILVDEHGRMIDGDQILARIALDMQADGLLRGGAVVSTIMANMELDNCMARSGLELKRTSVGDRHVIARMLADGHNLGGEPSGHVILSDHSTTGDGLVAALQIMAAMIRHGRSASEVCSVFEPRPQLRADIRIGDKDPLADAGISALIAAEDRALSGSGRVLVRKSGTEPVLRLMVEAGSESVASASLARLKEAIARQLAAA